MPNARPCRIGAIAGGETRAFCVTFSPRADLFYPIAGGSKMVGENPVLLRDRIQHAGPGGDSNGGLNAGAERADGAKPASQPILIIRDKIFLAALSLT